MQFSKIVLWGNKLKCWNTIPMSPRMDRKCFSFAGTIFPARSIFHKFLSSTNISPDVGSSKVISIRIIVVFPDPEGPIIHIFSDGAIFKSIPLRTSKSPNDLWTFLNLTIGSTKMLPPFYIAVEPDVDFLSKRRFIFFSRWLINKDEG